MNGNGSPDVGDLATLFAHFGPASWQYDLNVDGIVNAEDAATLTTQLLRTVPGDYNLDGMVDAADFTIWRDNMGAIGLIADGNFDGTVDQADYDVWKAAFGFQRGPLTGGSGAGASAVPESGTLTLAFLALVIGCVNVTCRQMSKAVKILPT